MNDLSKRILYISRAGIPIDAPGIRIYNIARIIRKIGYKIDFICDKEDYISGETRKEYDGFEYFYNDRVLINNKWQSFKNIIELISAHRIFKRVKDCCKRDKPYAIILYNDIYYLTKKLIKYCGENDIRLIADVTEWYGKRNSSKIGDRIVPYLTDKRIIKLDQIVNNIISISPYLHDYYSKLGCNTIFVPPVFNVPSELNIKKHNYYPDYVLNLVYAGSPGNKDILLPLLDAIEYINDKRIRIRIDLIGIDDMYLKSNWKDIKFESKAIIVHGKLPHEETLKIVKKADFGVLLRHNKRYAKAGFSTKFAECMSYGVAMICNSVGGTDSIISSMKDGVIIDSLETNTLTEVLEKLILMDPHDILRIRKNAYKKAENIFDNINYEETINNFLRNL